MVAARLAMPTCGFRASSQDLRQRLLPQHHARLNLTLPSGSLQAVGMDGGRCISPLVHALVIPLEKGMPCFKQRRPKHAFQV